MSATTRSTAQGIIDHLGGPDNIRSVTHCATRLRFELRDADRVDAEGLDAVDGVMGSVAQSGSRYQVIMGGGVQKAYNDIINLPDMRGHGQPSDADVKAAARSKARGKNAIIDGFFEYLSDSFRPILGVLLGASLIIAFAAVLDAVGVVDFRAEDKGASWIFIDAMWRAVFYFLPIMIAYNAAKKLNIDPWVGATIMGAMMTPEFMSLSDTERFRDTVCTVNETLGTESCTAHIFGIPLQLNEYGGQVFVPLIMVAILALVYKALQKVFPQNVQMVFVPFLSMVVMIPVTAFLIGPLGIWLGNGLGTGLAWLNGNAPIVFAILIPLLYPFLVPLGLHWPLNALMLANIQTLGYDFIQGPMGTWNFACFGATAGVLVLAWREKDLQMRQTATGALAAGLFGGISEPSLYGIHLRFKRIYPRMLVGCLVGGVIIGVLGGVTTQAFAFTSLLTIPVFDPMWKYVIAIAAAFVVAMVLVIISGYKDPEQPTSDDDTAPAAAGDVPSDAVAIAAPMAGEVVGLDDVEDKVFSSRALGEGVGIRPSDGHVVAPVAGTLVTVAETGHAYGLRTDDGIELLVHVGIDTVQLAGTGFDVQVAQGDTVTAGQTLCDVDLAEIRTAGFDTTTVVTVINAKDLTAVTPLIDRTVAVGEPVIDITR